MNQQMHCGIQPEDEWFDPQILRPCPCSLKALRVSSVNGLLECWRAGGTMLSSSGHKCVNGWRMTRSVKVFRMARRLQRSIYHFKALLFRPAETCGWLLRDDGRILLALWTPKRKPPHTLWVTGTNNLNSSSEANLGTISTWLNFNRMSVNLLVIKVKDVSDWKDKTRGSR